jgi:hypothetical protein
MLGKACVGMNRALRAIPKRRRAVGKALVFPVTT